MPGILKHPPHGFQGRQERGSNRHFERRRRQLHDGTLLHEFSSAVESQWVEFIVSIMH
jgi:hypothetical protein